MFIAVVLLCPIDTANDCLEFTDRYGPYAYVAHCEERVSEIISDINKYFKVGNVKFYYKCDLLHGLNA